MYRELDPQEICTTADALSRRIDARFPQSGLGRVARELRALAGHTHARVERLRHPHWPLRIAVWSAAALLVAAALAAPIFISVRTETPGLPDLMQGLDSAINNIVFIAIAIWFLVTAEQRPKRRAALAALHELRSIAHIIDMHQLKKDPEYVLSPDVAAAESLEAPLSRADLSRYLDYCSEMLSVVSKLAALYAQYFIDERVLDAVNDVETLAGTLSSKIWQKIVILDTIAMHGPETT
jgi:hypothetical protein